MQAPIITPDGTKYICSGNSITLTASSPISGTNFIWYKDGNSISGVNTLTYSTNSTGNYSIKFEKNGCIETSNVVSIILNSNIPQKPILTSSKSYVCGKGGQTNLTASGCSGTVNWYLSDSSLGTWVGVPLGLTASATINGLVKFNISCTENGCTSPLSDDIYVDFARVSVTASNYTICNNENIYLTATSIPSNNINSYNWGTSVVSSNNNTAITTSPGTYNAIVIYDDGCQVSSSQTTGTSAIITNLQNIQRPNLIVASQNSYGPTTKIWDKRFGTADFDVLRNLTVSDDHKNYLISGMTASFYNNSGNGDRTQPSRGKNDYWVIKIDSIGNKIWDKRFGSADDDVLTKSIKLKNNGLLLVGYTQGSGGDKTQGTYNDPTYGLRLDGWIIKLDSFGNKVWDKQYGGNIDDLLLDGFVENDNSYILAGHTNSDLSFDVSQNSRGSQDYWVIKIDSLGNKVWDIRFGGNNGDYFEKCIKTNDGGILLGGTSYSSVSGDKSQPITRSGYPDYWLVKLNANGIKQWDKTFNSNLNHTFYDVKVTNEGDIIFTGSNNLGADSDIYKLNSSGNIIWKKTYLNTSIFNKIFPNEKGILVTGTITSTNGIVTSPSKGSTDGFIMQLDSLGNRIWDRRFGGLEYDSFIDINPVNNGYITSGFSYSQISNDKTQPSWGMADFWILKFTNNQEIIQPIITNTQQSFQLIANNCIGNVIWSGGSTEQGPMITVSPSITTSYTATCFSNGCSTSSSIQVNINPCGQIVSLTQTENITTGTSQAPTTIKAQDSINATNTIGQPPTNASAKYTAGKTINLNPGFKVEIGSIFQAKISATPCNE
ncbi:hypothetical protein GCM10011514_22080 [Emticicia aquatilis]|uniref:Ig-like domain-containing protein n=1 Tax=Emticicia aquatilis TaxID=1537369 RepID=A0A917DQQ1_9BACT|nr:hypothetical protein GCM10011514_22080 [Emticicia aquatilis]